MGVGVATLHPRLSYGFVHANGIQTQPGQSQSGQSQSTEINDLSSGIKFDVGATLEAGLIIDLW